MQVSQLIERLKNIKGVVTISQFGSYGTKLWIENRSDIDLAVQSFEAVFFFQKNRKNIETINITSNRED